MKRVLFLVMTSSLALMLAACGAPTDAGDSGPGRGGRGGGSGSGPGAASAAAAVPVQTAPVTRRTIAEHLETNATLEAENEVDLVARTSGPVTALLVEEGDTVVRDQVLARIDEREARNQVAIATVSLNEARLAFDRAEATFNQGLVSREAYDAATSALEAAEAQVESAAIELTYTQIRAPFSGLVVNRYVKLAEHVNAGAPLFRISDFTPLLCPVEVPEKDLPRLAVGQPATLRVEAYPDERFVARVLRIRPTVDAATGTITVTLEVEGRGLLRPGMFASVFLQTDTHVDAIVIPRDALVLDSIGDTVFLLEDGMARRRQVQLGFREEDTIEVVSGLEPGEQLIVLGQDGLADGTPVTLLDGPGTTPAAPTAGGEGPPPEMVQQMRQRMRGRGLSEAEIDERISRTEQGGGARRPGGGSPGAGPPPQLLERLRSASPEQLEQMRNRMRDRGMSDEQIEAIIRKAREDGGGA